LAVREMEGIEIKTTQFSLENLEWVEDRTVDFTIMDTHVEVGEPPDSDSPRLKVAFHLESFGYAMALPEGSNLRPLLNSFLQRMQESGEVARLMAQYKME
jgi:ABC-type amino acid transport substrate-binding protein